MAARHVVQFTKSLKHIANYVLLNHNIEVEEAIRAKKKQVFTLPEKLVMVVTKDSSGKEVNT